MTLHNSSRFQELNFDRDRQLTIKTYDGDTVEQLVQTHAWSVELKNTKHYLYIVPKLQYEVITINHTVMVLADIHAREKVFFTKEAYWKEHLNTNHEVIL